MINDTYKIIFISAIIAIIIAFLAVLTYDIVRYHNQQEQIDNINNYLKGLIIGYTTPN